MRVVGGTARGRKLTAPAGRSTRPTSDQVKEAIFNVLGSRIDLEDTAVVDLFAGSGALGIEAISRGAARATFVESDPKAVAVIEANLASLGFAPRARVIRADVMRWLAGRPGAFDVAFADPPYDFDQWVEVFTDLDADLVVCETGTPFAIGSATPGHQLVTEKRYGSTVVTLVQQEEQTIAGEDRPDPRVV